MVLPTASIRNCCTVSGLLHVGFNTGDHTESSDLIGRLAEKHPRLCFDVTRGNSGALLRAGQSRDLAQAVRGSES